MKNPDELIQYYIINQDLNMSAGKIATQVAHIATNIATTMLLNNPENSEYIKYLNWWAKDQKKIILKAHQNKLEKLEEEFYSIRDLGLTEIEENSLTCVGLGVMTRKEAEPYIKRLQLL